MRLLGLFVLSVLCSSVMSAQVTGADLLEKEPEWVQIKGTGAAPYMTGNHPTSVIASAAQNYGRYQAVQGIIQGLSERLLDDLLVCAGRCKDQDAREEEFWIVQHNLPSYELSAMQDRAQSKVDGRWSDENTNAFNSPDGQSWSLVHERCYEVSGIKEGQESEYWDEAVHHSVLQSPEKVKKYNDCIAELTAIGIEHTGIDPSERGGRWKTHVAIWKYCAAMYQVEKSVFQQPAYNTCMNRYDVETIIRTKYRLGHGRHGDSMGELPTNKDLALLAQTPAIFKP